jgi:hypothetical protein
MGQSTLDSDIVSSLDGWRVVEQERCGAGSICM